MTSYNNEQAGLGYLKFEGQPSYKDDYPEWPLENRRQPYNEKPQWRPPSQKLDSDTTAKQDFKVHELSPRQTMKPVEENRFSTDPFDGRTGYKDIYVQHPLQEPYERPKETYKAPTEPFGGDTSNRKDFPKWDVDGRQKPYKANQDWRPPSKKFDENTTAKNDFKAYNVSPRESMRPLQEPIKSNQPMGDRTGYKDTYKAHQLPERTTRPKEIYKHPSEPFGEETTNHKDYPNWNMDGRQKNYRPDQKWRPPSKEFQVDTTAKNDFKQYSNISPRESMKPFQAPLKSDQPMGDKTGYKDTYKAHQLPERVARPKETYKQPTEPFGEETTNHKDYPNWNMDGRQKNYRPDQKWRPPSKEFQVDTTAKNDFKQYSDISPRESMRPVQEPLRSERPMDDRTGYKDTYKAHQLPERVARPKETYKQPTEPFGEETTNHKDYPNWNIDGRQKGYRADQKWRPPSKEFQVDTTTKNDFKQYNITPRESMRPVQEPIRSGQPMGDKTGYRDTYKAHELPERVVRPKESYKQPTEPFGGETTNFKDYPKWDVNGRQKGYRVDQKWRPPSKQIQTDTTAKTDYKQYGDISPRQSMKPIEEPLKSDRPMDDRTGYKDTYKAHQIPERTVRAKETYKQPTDPFGGETTNHKDYPNWEIDGRQKAYRTDQKWRPPSKEFQVDTTTKNDFKQYNVSPRESMRPTQAPMKSDQPLDDRTGYKDTYKAHQLPERTQRQKETYKRPTEPINTETTNVKDYPNWNIDGRQKPYGTGNKWRPSSKEFEAYTTNKSDFKQHNVSPRESMRPVQAAVMSDQPIDDRTGYKDSYVQHPLPERQKRERQAYKPPSQPCDTTTTNREDFKQWDGDARQRPYGENRTWKPPSGEFEKNTTTKGDFKAFDVAPRKIIKPTQETQMSNQPMDGRTGYKDLYVEHQLPERQRRVREEYKPSSQPFDDQTVNRQEYKKWDTDGRQRPYGEDKSWKPPRDRFEGDTNYNKDFTDKRVDACPASLLGTKSSDYSFERVNTRGHTEYKPSFGSMSDINQHSRPHKMEIMSKA